MELTWNNQSTNHNYGPMEITILVSITMEIYGKFTQLY